MRWIRRTCAEYQLLRQPLLGEVGVRAEEHAQEGATIRGEQLLQQGELGAREPGAMSEEKNYTNHKNWDHRIRQNHWEQKHRQN